MNSTTKCMIACIPIILIAMMSIIGCTTSHSLNRNKDISPYPLPLATQDYTFAIYNQAANLLTYPIEDLLNQINRRPISDIYLISHGWNYTLEDSMANYDHYIHYISQRLAERSEVVDSDFHPYFIFVMWPSVARPFGDSLNALLPFGLDRAMNPVSDILDRGLFYLPTAWKESINSSLIATAKSSQSSNIYSTEPYGHHKTDATQMGRALPLSLVMYKLYELKSEGALGDKNVKIHAVGHSYGAKVVALAALDSLDRWSSDRENSVEAIGELLQQHRPLESLVLVNPAMHVFELDLAARSDFFLQWIPRKAIVYSNYDYPNGLYFDLSQIVLNNFWTQLFHTVIDRPDVPSGAYACRDAVSPLRDICTIAMGGYTSAVFLGFGLPVSTIHWVLAKAIDLPADLFHHVRANETFDRLNAIIPGVRYPLNLVHFFLPFDQLAAGSQANRKGILRFTFPALGRTGLNQMLEGRWFLFAFKKRALLEYVDSSTDIDATEFCRWASEFSVQDHVPIANTRIYSFDASLVLNTAWSPAGAHNDFDSEEETTCNKTKLEKRAYIFNFIYNFTVRAQTKKQAALADGVD